MAIITLAEVTARSTVTYTGADATALTQMCADVDAALKRMLAPYYPEPLSGKVMYPTAYPLELMKLDYRPVRAVTSVYYRRDGYGVAARFTAAHLIDNTNGDQYTLDLDPITGRNDAGILRRVNRVWGGRYVSPAERMGYNLEPEVGAYQVTADIGPAAVPADIALAAYKAVLLLYQFRQTGIPQGSESWNGYNISYSQPFTADAAIRTPDVLALLAPYTSKAGMTLHVG